MKRLLLLLFFIHYLLSPSMAQDIPPETEQQLENLADLDQSETEDDSYLQQLAQFRKHPLSLNNAGEDDLRELRILTDLQIQSLLSYRRLFGNILDIYELQAIPSWDIITIRKLLPFVTINNNISLKEDAKERFRNGDHQFLVRASQVLEKSGGFDTGSTGTKYLGSPQRLFFRYRYAYKNIFQYGIAADKDAGEQFFKGTQRKGFDFYSVHLFVRKIGIVQSLALGDFTVNMGQGLIQWQSLAFKKSVNVTAVKRQSPVLRPYNSAGEYNFHRGAGITIKKGKIETTFFASLRKLSANFETGTTGHEDYFSSFQTSGYHRTETELADRNKLRQTCFGVAAKYTTSNWHMGINGIHYRFSSSLQKRDEPYNLFSITGDQWSNASIDYSYTYKNIHLFGETAVDKNFNKALLNGLLMSVDPKVDLSIVYRNISKKYQVVNANAFTENTSPSNEKGVYAGISIRPATAWRLEMYADMYRFPWLKYLVDAPSGGKDFVAQLTYTPGKQVELYTRFKNEAKQSNQPDNTTAMNFLVAFPKQNWRTHISYKINAAITLRNRIEMVWYDAKGKNSEKGFLFYTDVLYKPLMKPFAALLRFQYFETDGYNSRIYAYENDVFYGYSIPVSFGKGYRYYMTLNYDITPSISGWLRWAQSIYPGQKSIGSGLDAIDNNRKTEIKLQFLVQLQNRKN